MTDEEIMAAWKKAIVTVENQPLIVGFARAIIAIERERCAKLCLEECLPIGCNAIEADGVVRRTRNALAEAIRK